MMIGSTTPAFALDEPDEQSDWHPVHRANALLREALQSTTESFETLEARYGVESLSSAIESVMQGVHITYPTPLATRFDNLEAEERTILCLEALVGPVREIPGDQPPALGDDTADGPAPDKQEDGLAALPAKSVHDADDGQGFDDPDLLWPDAALEPAVPPSPRQLHMQTLAGEFRRRQRYVSLLVAASVATAVLLTVGGVVLTVSLTSSPPAASDHLAFPGSTSEVWQRPAPGKTGLPLSVAPANRAAKGEPLAGPTQGDFAPREPVAPQTILAASGRQIAFGPLLPTSHARYLLIRGLPSEATLSTGRQSGTGTWMVKGDKAADLTLALGQTAIGDYPIEVYVLESSDGPQARQSFMLRVAPSSPNSISAYERAVQDGNDKAAERLKVLASLSGTGPSD